MSNVLESLNPAPLNTTIVGSRVLIFPVVDSTNDRAFALGVDGAVVIADSQTAGRGRHGRSWASAAGMGLWFSVFLENEVLGLPFAGPLAVLDAFQDFYRDQTNVLMGKWPNDLLLRDKKCCGTLVERRASGTVIGIGINLLQRPEHFPEELQGKATSFQTEFGWTPGRAQFLRAVLHALDRNVLMLRTDPSCADFLSRRWFEICRMQGRSVSWKGGEGIIEGVNSSGALFVRQGSDLATVPFDDSVKVFPLNQWDAA